MPRHSEATLAAIKSAVDIVTLVGESLPVSRSGSKYKALCPFHDDHSPSLELNPDRQSYKCWSCGAGGDVFDFVMEYDRVEFPEALRMLAERAGVVLDAPSAATAEARGPSKGELLAVNAWAEGIFHEALKGSAEAKGYLEGRGLSPESVERFRLGYAPGERGWLVQRAKKAKFPIDLLEKAGLVSRPADHPGVVRERFRGRLIFPIHDQRGRAVGFGGRVLPEVEQFLAAAGKKVAKYLNSPETPLFQKRKVLYSWNLARASAREANWVAVVEGYTDVIAAHQVGLTNVVGTLGTALGDDHVTALRRLADRVVLIFDGDDAGRNAADRSLEMFLAHEVDVRVLTLPSNLDPCEFLLREGADAFRALAAGAVDPLAFALKRAEARFDLSSPEGSRKASEWILGVVASVRPNGGPGLDVKAAKALLTLAQRFRMPVETLQRRLKQIQREVRPKDPRLAPQAAARPDAEALQATPDIKTNADADPAPTVIPFRISDLDAIDRELVRAILNEPELIALVTSRVAPGSLRDAPLRTILQVCYDLNREGIPPTFDRVALRLEDSSVRALAAALLLPLDVAPAPDDVRPAPWANRLHSALALLAERDWTDRFRELNAALSETSEADDPATYRALILERFRLLTQRPDTKAKTAS